MESFDYVILGAGLDCIDRVITPDVDFKIPLGWENLRTRLLATLRLASEEKRRLCRIASFNATGSLFSLLTSLKQWIHVTSMHL
jgi:hypothetical protein